MRYFWTVPAVGVVLLAAAAVLAVAPAPEADLLKRIDFNRDIRPILSNNCFQCHGPDGKVRKAELRLDTPEGIVADLGGHAAVVRGKPNESALIERITSQETPMPPRKTGKKLTAREIELLKRWVQEGAPYARHWAYVKPVRPALPVVKDKNWSHNPIDLFLLARLESDGLKPGPEADRHVLIRRVALDLTGLPPTPEEVDAFIADKNTDAYEKLVDRLLAKEAYGEHQARTWLDLARYADSAGYANDPPRTIWAYRDYVIRAFNTNKPFDQFTVEQLAGDLLPNPTEEQNIATAFHRNTLTNSEGGTNREEFRNVAVVDRVNTTLTVWMGTSVACAQCHNHKFDPISQKEFFQLFAFLNNTEDNDSANEAPLLSFTTEEQKQQRAKLQAEIAVIEQKIKTPTPELRASQAAWESDFPRDVRWQTPKPGAARSLGGATLNIQENGAVLVPTGKKTDTYMVELPLAAPRLAALRLEVLPHESLPGKGPGHAPGGNFVLTHFRAAIQPMGTGAVRPVGFTTALADATQAGFDADTVLDEKQGKKRGWALGGFTGKPHTLTLLPAAAVEVPAGAKLVVTLEQASSQAQHTLGHFRLTVTDDPRAGEYVGTPPAVVQAILVPADKRTEPQRQLVTDHFLRHIAKEVKAERDRLAVLEKQLADMKPATVPVMRELPGDRRRKTRIQLRGNFLDVTDEVQESVPKAFHPLHADAPRNRLTLARWLVDENNPVTARVIANRVWEQIFGVGLVRTSEEFGSQGELPSHPELLDWLAVELIQLKWDMKAFLKRLVTTAAYRQSSRVTPQLFERDPDNRLLARGPRVRLTAEMVRDQALFVGGLLSPKMYGPSVKPPQPALGINAAFGGAIDWKTSEGPDRYRRGLYTEWRRSNPYPSLSTFDAPNREICMVRRTRTNTPLQALVTLNDTVFVEASQGLGRRMVGAGNTPAERIRHGFRLCLARTPHDDELARLTRLQEEVRAALVGDPEKAKQLATVPLGPVPQGMDVIDLASWTVVASVMLNLDEMVLKR